VNRDTGSYGQKICCGIVFERCRYGWNPAEAVARLAPDHPTMIENIEAVCTGVGLEAGLGHGWRTCPLKIETAGPEDQHVGNAIWTLSRGSKSRTNVQCDDPRLLFRLPAGRYRVGAEIESKSVHSAMLVPASGQGRIMLRFLSS
jgi:hypothetical protein